VAARRTAPAEVGPSYATAGAHAARLCQGVTGLNCQRGCSTIAMSGRHGTELSARLLYDCRVSRKPRISAQLRARTSLQLVSVLATVIIDVSGMTAIATGHQDLGRSLVGLGIILLVPLGLWMRRTNLSR
jgi:hypothetical protein